MTDEQLDEIIAAARDVAGYPPNKPKEHVFAALVPWSRIQRLRVALQAIGEYP